MFLIISQHAVFLKYIWSLKTTFFIARHLGICSAICILGNATLIWKNVIEDFPSYPLQWAIFNCIPSYSWFLSDDWSGLVWWQISCRQNQGWTTRAILRRPTVVLGFHKEVKRCNIWIFCPCCTRPFSSTPSAETTKQFLDQDLSAQNMNVHLLPSVPGWLAFNPETYCFLFLKALWPSDLVCILGQTYLEEVTVFKW